MIEALLIDDENLALKQLKKLLEEYSIIKVIATYTDPSIAVIEASEIQPDVIFLDINMPEMNGMQTAEMLQQACPATNIVFVTAYDEYALEAFEINAIDYVLKPVNRNRLAKTIQRLEERYSQASKNVSEDIEITIRCFQSLRFERNGELIHNIRWRTTRAQELFAYLLHNHNRFVSKDSLIDIFWPEYDQKKAMTHLYTTIYHVRQFLKQANITVHINNVSVGEGYMLDLQNVRLETVEWENSTRSLIPIDKHNYDEHQKLVDLYTGDYFADYDYMWAEGERQRLRTIWLYQAQQVADFYCNNDMITDAISVYERIVHVYPYFEDGHFGLMKAYDRLHERSAVEKQFLILQNLLENELSIQVSERVISWYKKWKLGNVN